VNEVAARRLIGLLIDVMQSEAREHLPEYVQDSWLAALSELLEKGLFHGWQAALERVSLVELEAGVVEIVDFREDV
jgi:hypothetical protein